MKKQKQTAISPGNQASNTGQPLVSVVMPVYNAAPYLTTAINSIQQQIVTNWELIIVDDGSTDDSVKIAQEFEAQDGRIKLFQQPHSGVSTTANFALSKARAPYIARMDADDIAFPNRLDRQLTYLQQHPETVAVGAQCVLINGQGETIGQKTFPTIFEELKQMMFYYYPLQQPTLMVNSQLLPADFKWYAPGLQAAEEHELLFKLLQFGQVVNLPDFLLFYRLHAHNVTKLQPKRDFWYILKTRIKGIYHYHYWPSLKAILFTLAQLFVVGLLPQKLIYPVYSKFRGLQQ